MSHTLTNMIKDFNNYISNKGKKISESFTINEQPATAYVLGVFTVGLLSTMLYMSNGNDIAIIADTPSNTGLETPASTLLPVPDDDPTILPSVEQETPLEENPVEVAENAIEETPNETTITEEPDIIKEPEAPEEIKEIPKEETKVGTTETTKETSTTPETEASKKKENKANDLDDDFDYDEYFI